METEEILLESPPRLSFSENVNLDAKLTGDGCERNDGFRPVEAAGSIDFNFSVIFQSSNSTDSSDADELFFDGKLLPFFKSTTVPTATEKNSSGLQLPRSIFDHGGTLDAISESTADSGGKEGHRRHNSRHSIWRFGRSSSVGSFAPTGPILPYFPPLHRSKSTESFFPTPRWPPRIRRRRRRARSSRWIRIRGRRTITREAKEVRIGAPGEGFGSPRC
ncbi:hypothetical protein KSP40_PGU018596 [Platanthera guangdongensis]|uniref:Uncharacterized protein n=1 Tax=Platanthera guangdongensis TaxID=2320717 RepID=A0ABR2LE47_9ASPA